LFYSKKKEKENALRSQRKSTHIHMHAKKQKYRKEHRGCLMIMFSF